MEREEWLTSKPPCFPLYSFLLTASSSSHLSLSPQRTFSVVIYTSSQSSYSTYINTEYVILSVK